MLPIVILIFMYLTCQVDASVTINYIQKNNYTVEEHKVQTEDGYMLTIYRIPYSIKVDKQRSPVLLHHGFMLSSDSWIIPNVELGLAYKLAENGFDVWLGNQRGNRYSREHKTMQTNDSSFWNFSFHEIGYYDIAAIVDYMRIKTGYKAVHFIGYSQGTSSLLALLATRPQYAAYMRTVHFLAPIIFMQSTKNLIIQFGGHFIDYAMLLSTWLGYHEVFYFSNIPLYRFACSHLCAEGAPFQYVCQTFLEFLGGFGSKNLDLRTLVDICKYNLAGASSKQILHFLQVFKSGIFRQYDYGSDALNLVYYQQTVPPAYDITNVTQCIHLYYAKNDYFSDVEDVIQLSGVLKCAILHELPYDDWNHYDFLWSTNTNEALNYNIISIMVQHDDNTQKWYSKYS